MLRRSINGGTTGASGNWEGYRAESLTAARWLLLMTLVALMTSAWAVTPKDVLTHSPTCYLNNHAQVVQPAPQFRTRNYDESLRHGLAAVVAAADGEYQGAGKTAAEQNSHHRGISGSMALVIFVLLVLLPVSTVILAFRLGRRYRLRRSDRRR